VAYDTVRNRAHLKLREFVDLGLLQEVNRLFFHPMGLALEVTNFNDGDKVLLSGIQDNRHDPEGMMFAKPPSRVKAEWVEQLRDTKLSARLEALGWVIQPVGG